MSIFAKIMDAVLGKKDAVASAATTVAAAPVANVAQAAGGVDVEAILTALAAKAGRPSNWRTSIVDLMQLLGMDHSLAQRQELAKELGYTGDMNDSASMNIWLHKQVMTQMAANGGKVPSSLLS
jgi:uncharacterized protein YpuA (DUF1002 family)